MQAAPDISETLETPPTHQPLAPNVDGSWHYFVAHSIKVSRATFAEINNDVMKLLKAMDVRRAREKKEDRSNHLWTVRNTPLQVQENRGKE